MSHSDPLEFVKNTICQTILYEGYSLYPYRPTELKTKIPPVFGVVHPKEHAVLRKEAYSEIQTECLIVEDIEESCLDVCVRFLQLREISIFQQRTGGYREVKGLDFEGNKYASGKQSLERDIQPDSVSLQQLLKQKGGFCKKVSYPSEIKEEIILSKDSKIVGKTQARSYRLECNIEIQVERLSPVKDDAEEQSPLKVRVRVQNNTPIPDPQDGRQIPFSSFYSCQVILRINGGGRFLSPTASGLAVAHCHNRQTWPVLLRKEDDLLLSAPIILYDYPELAPESLRNFFESTEIEEYLLLHLALLNEQEKKEIVASDPKLKPLVEQLEGILNREQMTKLHGMAKKIVS